MMTRTIQRQDSAQDTSLSQPKVTEGTSGISTSSLHGATDSASDNDTGERPVREKLKKTSIASIPKNSLVGPRAQMETAQGDAMSNQHVEEDPVTKRDIIDPSVGSRGRSLRKRSFEDFETTKGDGVEVDEQSPGISSGHARKRSRDVRVDAGLEEELRTSDNAKIPVQEVDEQNLNDNEMIEPDNNGGIAKIPVQEVDEQNLNDNEMIEPDNNHPMLAPQNVPNPIDQDMRDSALSPRKKRSRDLDTDTYREQKIPATKGIKAMRSSDEIEPDALPQTSNNDATPAEDIAINGQPMKTSEVSATAVDGAVALNQMAEVPRNSSANSPFAPVSRPPNKSGDEPFATSKTAFATSGFAPLSESTTSPFGSLGPSLTTTNNATPFGPVLWRKEPENLQAEEVSVEKLDQVRSASSGPTAPPISLGFGIKGKSPFASSSVSTPNAFAGATFGSGFGNTFAGAKLSSFAAPVGDAKWGGGGGEVMSFGAPAKDDEDERSESEEEGLGDAAKEQEGGDVHEKFQQQDVDTGEEGEESIFSSPRVNLYSWNGAAWKEGGRGTFKLNVPISKLNEAPNLQKTGRFIMRAHQTYRVLLNTPVFKQMKIGDSKGNEPQGKSLSFAVIEDGKPTPYLIKLSDEGESKTLYREVRKLQQAL